MLQLKLELEVDEQKKLLALWCSYHHSTQSRRFLNIFADGQSITFCGKYIRFIHYSTAEDVCSERWEIRTTGRLAIKNRPFMQSP